MVALMRAQPAWKEEAIPLSRFKLGMPARTHFVLGKKKQARKFSQMNGIAFGARLRDALAPSLNYVATIAGKCAWTSEAFGAFNQWAGDMSGREPCRNGQIRNWSGLVEGYGDRRAEHCAKLALILTCARGQKEIDLEAFMDAKELLWDTEEDLDAIMAMVGANPRRTQEDEVLEWVKASGEVSEAALRAHMRNFFDTRIVSMTIDNLETAGLLLKTERTHPPTRRFKA